MAAASYRQEKIDYSPGVRTRRGQNALIHAGSAGSGPGHGDKHKVSLVLGLEIAPDQLYSDLIRDSGLHPDPAVRDKIADRLMGDLRVRLCSCRVSRSAHRQKHHHREHHGQSLCTYLEKLCFHKTSFIKIMRDER